MTPAYIALFVGALSASFISRINLRGMIWVVVSQIAFWLPVLYWDFDLPLPVLFVAICDSLVVYFIYKFAREKWEEWLMLIFVGSIFTSFAAQIMLMFNEGFNIYVYSWSLYILNWAAILLIGTISGFKELGNVRDYIAFADWSSFLGRERIMERKEVGK